MTVQPRASRPSYLVGWVGFWLWALVGTGLVLGLLSLGVLLLVPAVVLAVVLARRATSSDTRVLLGLIAGIGLPLLLVAGLNWSAWNDRIIGDGTPNPYYWGGVGLFLLVVGVAAYALLRRPND
ncbi:MAG TPA: hypothetical protein VKB43_07570 [Gaiellaceae bacterium]|nr:hypothetical protein [Gaiellaceae bacterium]